MKRFILLSFAAIVGLGLVALFSDDVSHLIRDGGVHGDEHVRAATTESGAHEDGHEEHAAKDSHDDHKSEAGGGDNHEGSEIRLTDAQVKLAGIESVEAKLDRIDSTIQLTGEVRVNHDRVVQVVPRVPGVVRAVRFFLGDDVEQGAVMAVIDSRDLADAKSEYIASRERTKLARSKFNREDRLWRKRISSEQEFLDAKSALTEAQIAERAAAQKLRALGVSTKGLKSDLVGQGNSLPRFEIVAPFGGTVIEKHVTTGASVDEKEPIYRIVDLDTVWVIASVYEKDLARVSRGQVAVITTNAYPEKNFQGRITWIADTVEERTRTLKVRVEVKNLDRKLKPGMFVRANVVIGSRDGVLTIPESAVRRQGGETVVFVDEGGGRFERRDVALGARSNGVFEVRNGLKHGERVVAAGSFILKSELEKEGFGGGHAH